ncbi:MAG: hypothetical protein QM811_15800 [Pirellulales bacterium]
MVRRDLRGISVGYSDACAITYVAALAILSLMLAWIGMWMLIH